MKIEKIEILRIAYEDDYYCEIAPSFEYDGVRSFKLFKKGYGVGMEMFGAAVETDDEAIEIAYNNIEQYIDMLDDMCGE